MSLSPKHSALVKSYLRAFLAAALAVLAAQLQAGNLDWIAVLYAGVTAVAGPLLKWLDPAETAFGRGAE